jgi:hypothetical protein
MNRSGNSRDTTAEDHHAGHVNNGEPSDVDGPWSPPSVEKVQFWSALHEVTTAIPVDAITTFGPLDSRLQLPLSNIPALMRLIKARAPIEQQTVTLPPRIVR